VPASITGGLLPGKYSVPNAGKVLTGSFFQVLLMRMSITDAVILTHADKKKGRGSLFLPEKQ